MIRIIIALLLCVCVPLSPAWSDTPFEKARSLWLVGDDALSLPLLAELARERDMRARVLLGRIETMDKGPSPYRMALPRAEARALFRNVEASGRFGRSWLRIEALSGSDLAEAFLAARSPEPDLGLIKVLTQLGEAQATDYPTRIMALYGSDETRKALLDSGVMLEELQPYLAYLSGTPEPRGDGLAALRHIAGDGYGSITAQESDALGMAGILALGHGFGDLAPDNRWRPVVEEWLMRAEATRPIADLCRGTCEADAPACAFALMALTGGYYEVIRLDSPTETYIPQEEFLASPRARIMALRRAALARAETNLGWVAEVDEIAQVSQCAADMIAETRTNYK